MNARWIRIPLTQVSAVALLAFAACALFCADASAVTLHMLPIGDPGNVVDSRPFANLGSVPYTYYLDKYDVTNEQYAEFLNAKAVNADPFALFASDMGDNPNGGITRSASAPFAYSVKPGMANKPVVFVSWYDALRFTNWLTNGQGNGDTESGSYLITGGGPNSGIATVPTAAQRAAWASSSLHYLLPSSNEWYKAGFYKGGGPNAGYRTYPFANGQAPRSIAPGGPASTDGANIATNGGDFALPGPVYLTDVGAYNNPGTYGQFDMGGNVFQYTDSPGRGGNSALIDEWGGSFSLSADATSYLSGGASSPQTGFDDIGFRVMMVPEPGSVTLAALAALGVFAWQCGRLRRRCQLGPLQVSV